LSGNVDGTFRAVKRLFLILIQKISESVFGFFVGMIETLQTINAVEIAGSHHLSFRAHYDVVDNLIFHFSFLFT
jgi:hypothetical protein